jgi:predicted DNA-binding transcriptional regulator AlpA
MSADAPAIPIPIPSPTPEAADGPSLPSAGAAPRAARRAGRPEPAELAERLLELLARPEVAERLAGLLAAAAVPELPAMADARAVAAWLGVDERTVRRLSEAGELPKPITVGGSVRWPRGSLLNWLTRKGGR